MARKTRPPEQDRHIVFIQGRIYSQALLFRSSVLRALPIRQASVPRESNPLDLVHSDICGPMPHQSLGGASYFVTFIDDATRKVWAYPTRTKDLVFTIFKDWLTMVENQTDRKLKCLRSDNGGEYKSDEFVQFCQERGIRREFTAPYSPEQNGVAERMNRTIQEWILSMLHHSGLSEGFWLRHY
jgi:transposase InsO family protein